MMPGRMLGGRYQVQDKIGTGGMATVFRGLDEVLGRTVAIKTMLPQYATDPSFAARFKQEAQAAAALQSPYIVSVYDWGKDADTYYIVMEYLRGTDLKTGIRNHGALDCKKVAQIGSQIAQALSVAHKHDIIHRDIKPQNIMVQLDGNIKVMDFGIARAKNSHLTQDNSVLGTAHYVSPEQTQGKELGPTTDIYSLGIVMYESVTGQVPFKGDDAISVALKQVNEQPLPPSQLNPKVDPSLEAIILKCMQKNPADRFQTADELYRTLRDYLAGRLSSVNTATATAMLPAQGTNRIQPGQRAVSSTAAMPRAAVNPSRTGNFRPQSATDQAAQEEAEREKKHKRNVVIGVVVGIVLLAAAAVAAFSLLNSGSKTYAVPNLSGYTREQAEAAIKSAAGNFTVGTVTETYDDTVAEGYVVDQSPNANREVAEGSQISFRISKGKEPAATVTVPDLSGKTVDEAEKLLNAQQLKGKAGGTENSDTVEAGKICRQDVAANSSAKAGDTITYYVSLGVGEITVPNVTGDSESSATSTMTEKGFQVSTTYEYSDTVDNGYVIRTTPAKGSSAKKGDTITLVVSKGKEDTTVSVPNVVGMTYSTAKSTLVNAGFSVSLGSGSESGTVTDQSVTGRAEKGTSIVLTCTTPSSNSGSGNNSGSGSGGNSGNNSSSGSNNGGSGTGTGESTVTE